LKQHQLYGLKSFKWVKTDFQDLAGTLIKVLVKCLVNCIDRIDIYSLLFLIATLSGLSVSSYRL